MILPTLQSVPPINVPAGHVLITEGEPLAGLYFLESGEVEVFKRGVLIAEIFEPGAVLGEMSWLLKTTPTATVKASTACTLRHVADPAEHFLKNPETTIEIAVVLARRLDSMASYLVEIKNQFQDRADHLRIIDEVLDTLMHKRPRDIPRRSTGD